ncbi:alpha-tocopherol transfer protein-like [Bicyclus anynana]|uniref:Alpha-tocopherol transfer protein-like n=1 Tax=Bicyclus anynana TaxID=110368 RepID=A0ABM3LIL2_BICAN|nr:alpha-tocopherol transfer protein-like [Bicyclus anynana]
MIFLYKSKILELEPDTVQYVRKQYNLDKPGRMEDAVALLREWVQKQSHFNKKDFSDQYLEVTIIICKGSVERAKTQLDKMCTFRTLMPEFFGNRIMKEDYERYHKIAKAVVLPKLTPDHYRVYLAKYNDGDWKASDAIFLYRQSIYLAEYIKAHDYLSGFVLVADFTEANLLDYLPKLSILECRQIMTILMEGYGMRVKQMHVISKSKLVDGLVTFMKKMVSAKIGDRIKVHKNIEDLYEYIPKAILPKDFGGDERSLDTLQAEWIDAFSSDEYLKYLQEMNEATTNESCRPRDQFSEHYAGMPGTFRYLTVD